MILAAGRGERLAPLTDHVPKPLIEIGGETLVERHLHALAAAGIREVVINLAHLGERIEQRLGDGRDHGLAIRYSREPDGALETAGGIVRALPMLGEEPFLVLNADVWTDLELPPTPPGDLRDAHLVLVPNPPHNPEGDFALEGALVRKQGVNPLTFAGIGIYRARLFAGISAGRAPLGPLLAAAASADRVTGEVHRGAWIDVGTPERLEAARRAAGEPSGDPART